MTLNLMTVAQNYLSLTKNKDNSTLKPTSSKNTNFFDERGEENLLSFSYTFAPLLISSNCKFSILHERTCRNPKTVVGMVKP